MSPDIPEGSIIITPTEVYNEVKSLTEAVRTLITREEAEREDRNELKKDVAALGARVSRLEQRLFVASGFCAALGGIAGVLAPSLFK